MEKETKKGLHEFLSALGAGAIGGALGAYLADLFSLHWVFLGLSVAAMFLVSYKALLLFFGKIT